MALTVGMCLRNTKSFMRLCSLKSHPNHISTAARASFHRGLYSQYPKLTRLLDTPPNSSFVGSRFFQTWHLSDVWSETCVRCSRVCPSLSLTHCRLMSSEKGGITDQILQSKIVQNEELKSEEKSPNSEQQQPEQKDKGKSKTSWLTGPNAWKLGLLSLAAMGVLVCGNLIMLWGTPIRDQDGNEIEDEFSSLPTWSAYPRRAYKEARFFKKMIEEPSYTKLLPDPLKEPWYQPPYTLVIELTGVLVHPDWTLGTGWRFKKRPAVTHFLSQVASPLFEVVIFTKEQGFTAFPLIDSLDPNGHVTFRLFRDATRYMNGSHVKDLDNLNRDLSKVILVDCDPKAFQKHPRNALLLQKWSGEDSDRRLLDLAAFLRTIAMSSVDDVRPVLEHYNQFDDPLEAFKENQRRLQGEQERATKTPEMPENQGLMGFGKSFLRRR